ncbi:MAG: GatB/YqeY domain-containing protein [Calditrichaceae bacterium]
MAQIKDERIKLRVKREMTEEDVIGVLLNAAKKRKESSEIYRQNNREDLAAKEEAELKLIQKYLPKQISGDEIKEIISRIIQQTNATSIKDLGKVMGAAMKELKGKADGQLIQSIVRDQLSQI